MATRARQQRIILLVAALAGCAGSPAFAQSGPPRVHVGLALGGGSARGFAHIGVLQWLEDHRVPVDVVGGTSMGALIGGAYATGLSPGEIRTQIVSLDWATLLALDSPFASKSFRRKEDARAYPTQLRLGLKGGLRLPSALSAGAQVELLFDRISAPYSAGLRFDDLPTPFRAVATDLRKAAIMVFESGWLARALRASMAIPGVFSPVALGDAMLVDGAVLNNVPADVVKATGLADVVIAVDVGADLTYQQRSDSLFAVISEATDVTIRSATRRALESADVVLQPDLMGYQSAEFERAQELIDRGYQAAEAHAAELMRFAVGEAEYAEWSAARQARRKTDVPRTAFIRVEGVSAREAGDILRHLKRHLDKPLDPNLLDSDLTNVVGEGRYESATYEVQDEGGRSGLVVSVRPKTHGPPFLSGALDLHSTQWSDVVATVRGRVLFFDTAGAGSEGRLDFSLGNTLLMAGEVYRPFGRTGVFVSPRAYTEREHFPVFADTKYTAEYRVRSSGTSVDFGYSAGRRFEARLGYGIEDTHSETRIGTSGLPAVDATQRFVQATAVYDGQTGPTIPERGTYAAASLRHYFDGASVQLDDGSVLSEPRGLSSGDLLVSWFHPAGRRGRIFLRAAGGTSFSQRTAVHAFTLGGRFRIGTYHEDELRGSHYALANAGYFREVMRLAEGAVGRLYFGIWAEAGSVFERRQDARIQTAVSGGFVVESPIGPVLLGGSIDGNQGYRAPALVPTQERPTFTPPRSPGVRVYISVGPLFGRWNGSRSR